MMWHVIAWLLSRPIIRRALLRWSFRRPYSDIRKGDSVYMRRFWVFNPYPTDPHCRESRLPSARVHHIMRPDDDRHLQDHPWDARTVILSGWYDELLADGSVVRREKGYTGRIDFGQYHSIVAVSPGGVWTLFITYRYRGTWGFLVDGVKVKWREYLGLAPSWHDAPRWATHRHKCPIWGWVWLHESVFSPQAFCGWQARTVDPRDDEPELFYTAQNIDQDTFERRPTK